MLVRLMGRPDLRAGSFQACLTVLTDTLDGSANFDSCRPSPSRIHHTQTLVGWHLATKDKMLHWAKMLLNRLETLSATTEQCEKTMATIEEKYYRICARFANYADIDR